MLAMFETDDLSTPEVNADPYGYFGHLRESDPVHWNPLHNMWIVTRHDHILWLLRQPDLFSSEVSMIEASPDFHPIDESDQEIAKYVRDTFRPFLLHDRPEHLAMSSGAEMSIRGNIAIRVNHDLCVGNAMCRSLAPAAFLADENGQSVVADTHSESIDDLFEAAALCPVSAISLEDTTTGRELEAP